MSYTRIVGQRLGGIFTKPVQLMLERFGNYLLECPALNQRYIREAWSKKEREREREREREKERKD